MSTIEQILEHGGVNVVGGKCCCPIHGEKTPSFNIYKETDSWFCLAAETRVITSKGVLAISELSGGVHTILTDGGEWVQAPFKSFGVQPLMRLRISRSGETKDIYATAEHDWYVQRKVGPIKTKDLIPGTLLQSARFNMPEVFELDRKGVQHGIVFGDGTLEKKRLRSGENKTYSARAYLYGDKYESLSMWFSEYSGLMYHKRAGLLQYVITGLDKGFKNLPDIGADRGYLFGFLAGWIATDGCVDKGGSVMINSSKLAELEYLQNLCTVLGINTSNITSQNRKGYGRENTQLYKIYFHKDTFPKVLLLNPKHSERFVGGGFSGKTAWKVVAVERTDRIEEVFCAVVEKTHRFALEGNILTGNCFGCDKGGDAIDLIQMWDKVGFRKAVNKYREITGDYESYQRQEAIEDIMGKPFDDDVAAQIKKETGTDSKNYRGIRTDTSKPFGVRWRYSQEDASIQAMYCPTTIGYELSGYKVRNHPKDFTAPYGETGKECEMFGQFRFKTQKDTVIITGGEVDVLSAFQMLLDNQKAKQYDPVAVVCSTIGEGGTYKQVQAQYEFFNQFKKIIVCLDNDKAGNEAKKKVIDVLPVGKVYVMNMRYKDPNEYLKNGKQHEFVSDFWGARPYTPDGVKSAMDAFDDVEEEVSKKRITLPPYMRKMQGMMGGGMLQGRICNIIAHTATGKSTHVDRMVYHWIFNSPVTPTIVSLEATAAQYVIGMMSVHLEKNMMWTMSGEEIVAYLKTDEGQAVKQELCFKENGEPRFYIIDDRSSNIKGLEEQMTLLNKKHNCKLFVLDVLTDALRGSSEVFAEDHMVFQKNFIKDGSTIINVLHTRKPQQNKDGKQLKVTEYDALGTGSFVQSGAYNIVLNRDKLSEDPVLQNTTEAELPKCRGGKTGPAGHWYYDFNTCQCYDLDDWLAMQ